MLAPARATLRSLVVICASVFALTVARPAAADDVADEADLQFRLGVARY